MTPHWPWPVVWWVLVAWTVLLVVGTVAWWWLCRPTRDRRAAEDVAAWKAQQR